MHADVAHPAGHRRRADVLPALPDEPRAEGAAAHHRRQRLEVAEELPGVGSQPQGLPLSRRTGSSPSCATTSRRCSRRSSRTILQQEIKNENVEAAFADYLEGLDEIARLDVRGVWFEEREPHRMVAAAAEALRIPPAPPAPNGTTAPTTSSRARSTRRTSGTTGGSRTAATGPPWEKIDVDIEGDHLVPVDLPAPDAPVLDAVPRGQQAGAAARPGAQGAAADARARTGRSSSPTRSTTAGAGRASGCRRGGVVDDQIVPHAEQGEPPQRRSTAAASCRRPTTRCGPPSSSRRSARAAAPPLLPCRSDRSAADDMRCRAARGASAWRRSS